MNDLADETLMAQVAVGEFAALEILMERYRRRVYGVLFRVLGSSSETDDLFQETWIRVARRASSFDPARKFAPWLARIASNLAIDTLHAVAKHSDQDPEVALDAQCVAAGSPEQDIHCLRHWELCVAPIGRQFVTSDDPVVLDFEKGVTGHMFKSPGVGRQDTVVSFVIGPRHSISSALPALCVLAADPSNSTAADLAMQAIVRIAP